MIFCLPNKLQKVTKFMETYALHWPALVHKGRGRYANPGARTSIFPERSGILCSITQTYKKMLGSVGNHDLDEMKVFRV